MQRQSPQHSITNYISISSIDDYSSKVEQPGGKIIFLKPRYPKWDI
jgi:predicted enzyme related to lactoylglutathione lyase